MTSILLTRSADLNQELRSSLNIEGSYEILECNLIGHIPTKFMTDTSLYSSLIGSYDFIIVTSYFCAKNIPPTHHIQVDPLMPIGFKVPKVFVVGRKSADVIAAKGYDIVHVTDNAKQLFDILVDDVLKRSIYLMGDNASEELPATLAREVVYRVEYRQHLEQEEIERYRQKIDYVLIYSKKSLLTFLALLERYNLSSFFKNHTSLIAISDSVASCARTRDMDMFSDIIVSPSPEQMIETLLQVLKQEV